MIKSDAYYRRQELMNDVNLFPQQTEVKARHGEALSNIMYEFFPDSIKADCNLIPKMDGPGEDLWVSPSDLLIPFVRLTPPLTSKCVQALTHHGILEIGSIVEVKFRNKMERDQEKALKFLEEQLRYTAEKEKRRAIAEEKHFAKMELEYTINRMQEECETSLKDALQELEERMLIEQDLKVRKAQLEVEVTMDRKLVEAVIEKARELSEEFERAFKIQAEAYDQELQEAIRIEKEICADALRNALKDKVQCLKFLRHDIECRNMANIMYVLSIERERYRTEIQMTHDEYKIVIDDMTSRTLDLYNRIIDLENETERKGMELTAWKERMIEIINQFQKFINFVFRAVPTQAEFLLNLTNLVRIVIKEEEKKKRSSNLIKFRGVDKNIPPNQPGITTEEQLANLNKLAVDSMENIMEYKTTSPGPPTPLNSERTLKSDEDLPIFYYNKYLYMREDFRNKTIPDSPLLKIWSVHSDTSQKPYKSGVFSETDMKVNYPIASNVRFNAKASKEISSENSKASLDMRQLRGASSSSSAFAEIFKAEDKNMSVKDYQVSMTSVACEEAKDNISKLKKIAVEKDSLIKHRASLRNSKTDDSDSEIIAQVNSVPNQSTRRPSRLLEVRNSLILARQSLTPKNVRKNSTEITEVKPKVPSRLLGTRNSLIIHRNSLRLPSKENVQEKSISEELRKKFASDTSNGPKSHPTHISLVAPESETQLKPCGSLKEAKEAKSSSYTTHSPKRSQSTSLHVFYDTKQKQLESQKPMQKVVGDRVGWEHLQTPDEFGNHRFNYMMNLLKENKSLLNLFTKIRK